MGNDAGRIYVLERNVQTLMEVVDRLQEQHQEWAEKVVRLEREVVVARETVQEVNTSLSAVNLEALVPAVLQLQEKWRQFNREHEG